jgi:2-polyprenyl-3-methyl-5-hydroxy-6-metoxy-1,4-benzoquinol methylase
MDDLSRTNRERWNALARANVEWSRPYLEYTREQAAANISRFGVLKDVAGKRVLCLAGGGGQGSIAFALMGADVTVLDLSDEQLARDRLAAAHHGLQLNTIQGDMRDLSIFPDNVFDIVWQVYSINFVPSVEVVFSGVRRVLKPGGIYFVQFANPFVQAVDDQAWDGKAYSLNAPYLDGEDITFRFPHWDVPQEDGTSLQLLSPHEFRHTLSTVLNTLVGLGFSLIGLWEWQKQDENPEPGSWAHFTQIAPPWFSSFWRLGKQD